MFIDIDHFKLNEVIIIDARPRIFYTKSHIKDAVNIPISQIMDPLTGMPKPPEELSDVFTNAGIVENVPIVIYDDYPGVNAARLAWTLHYCGLKNVAIIRKFFRYISAHLPIENSNAPPQRGRVRCVQNPNVLADYDTVKNYKGLIVDLRSRREYIKGHIKGAVNIPWSDLINNEGFLNDYTWLPHDEEVIVYCGQGLYSAIGYVAYADLGIRVRLYAGGYQDWLKHEANQE
ncbi:sulfurtransferase [Pyrobaculum aerophilum]|uniref:Thiosulfate sulfurtransferase n=1 Tax=Pyrobaculum aerophilum (strain ATCC 51768 / DSM 7523 / JCM 9630 / CIP 104966 / NBRC 100827 / IM2) TaxID=178306 RepID=Q8ZUV9_PYRAE|nr:sulfurtransferase [Pyrobaculum aerophilum]AAL64297.1 thiosulfate sulfurtransferase [Pyrobaculum aerophilum str. IM2]MCX8137828.1 sulfurtransferase [Pyrobaculum aerophilum]